jgi:hypothetical protein
MAMPLQQDLMLQLEILNFHTARWEHTTLILLNQRSVIVKLVQRTLSQTQLDNQTALLVHQLLKVQLVQQSASVKGPIENSFRVEMLVFAKIGITTYQMVKIFLKSMARLIAMRIYSLIVMALLPSTV